MYSKKTTEVILEWEAVKKWAKEEKDFLQKGLNWIRNFDWEGNLHKIFWVILLVISAILLRDFLFGIICLVFGGLFFMWFFDGKKKIM